MRKTRTRIKWLSASAAMFALGACSQIVPSDSLPPYTALRERCLHQQQQTISADESIRKTEICPSVVRDEYAAYELRSDMEIRCTAFINHQAPGSTILVFVIVTTACDVMLAGVQLIPGSRLALRGSSSSADSSTVKLALTAMYVKSSVTGVAIIALSFGFFFLCIRYVYPLSELKVPNSTGAELTTRSAGTRKNPGMGKILEDSVVPVSVSSAPASSVSRRDGEQKDCAAHLAEGRPQAHKRPIHHHKVRRPCGN